jgi:hypothetical protein
VGLFFLRRFRRTRSSYWSSQADSNDRDIEFVSHLAALDDTTLVTFVDQVTTYEGGTSNITAPSSVFTLHAAEALY